MIFEDVTEGTNGLVVLLLADMNLADVHERIVSEWVLGKALCEGLEEFKRFVVLFGLVDVLSSRNRRAGIACSASAFWLVNRTS